MGSWGLGCLKGHLQVRMPPTTFSLPELYRSVFFPVLSRAGVEQRDSRQWRVGCVGKELERVSTEVQRLLWKSSRSSAEYIMTEACACALVLPQRAGTRGQQAMLFLVSNMRVCCWQCSLLSKLKHFYIVLLHACPCSDRAPGHVLQLLGDLLLVLIGLCLQEPGSAENAGAGGLQGHHCRAGGRHEAAEVTHTALRHAAWWHIISWTDYRDASQDLSIWV